MARIPVLLISLLLLGLAAAPAIAQKPPVSVDKQLLAERNSKLDKLFDVLGAATNADDAREFAAQIWALWYQSGNGDVDLVMRQARTTMRSGQLPLALEMVDQALRMMPNYAEAWNLRATILFYLGRDAESVADIERTLSLEPRHFGAWAGMVMISSRTGDWKSALKALKAGLKIHPYLQEKKLLQRLEELAKGQSL